MDWELALWEALYLCISPKRVYRNIYYHKQTKNQWSRDDPAFVILLVFCVTGFYIYNNNCFLFLFFSFLVSAIAYGLAFTSGIVVIMKLWVYMVLQDFLLIGIIVATTTWYI